MSEFVNEQLMPAVNAIWERFIDLVTAPAQYHEMIWIILPLIFTLVVMEFYFNRYKVEELGWNTAVGNSIVLMFIAIDLFRHIYGKSPELLSTIGSISDVNEVFAIVHPVVIMAVVVGLWGLGLMFFNFFHVMPKKLAFLISSALPVNVTAYVAIILVYTNLAEGAFKIPFDIITVYSALFMFGLLFAGFKVIGVFVPKSKDIVEEKVAAVREVIEEEVKEEEKEKKLEEKVKKAEEKKAKKAEKEILNEMNDSYIDKDGKIKKK